MSTSLLERMAAIRENSNMSTSSEAVNPTRLEDFIRIYNKSRECYTDYMKGAKLLYEYLSPIEIPNTLIFTNSDTPALLHAYELGRLAEIVSGKCYGAEYMYAQNLIEYYTAKHILEGVLS
jgi:hypothetical protein